MNDPSFDEKVVQETSAAYADRATLVRRFDELVDIDPVEALRFVQRAADAEDERRRFVQQHAEKVANELFAPVKKAFSAWCDAGLVDRMGRPARYQFVPGWNHARAIGLNATEGGRILIQAEPAYTRNTAVPMIHCRVEYSGSGYSTADTFASPSYAIRWLAQALIQHKFRLGKEDPE